MVSIYGQKVSLPRIAGTADAVRWFFQTGIFRDTHRETYVPWEAADANMETIKSLKSDIRRFQQELLAIWMFISKEELVYEAREYLEETDHGRKHFPLFIQ